MNESQRAFERALHESTAIADRIREAIADAPPKLVMLALSDLLQETPHALGGRAGQGANAAPEIALVVRVLAGCSVPAPLTPAGPQPAMPATQPLSQ